MRRYIRTQHTDTQNIAFTQLVPLMRKDGKLHYIFLLFIDNKNQNLSNFIVYRQQKSTQPKRIKHKICSGTTRLFHLGNVVTYDTNN